MFKIILKYVVKDRSSRRSESFIQALVDHNIAEVDVDLVTNSGLFDEDFYLAANPDVKAAGLEFPLLHYIISGGIEGRQPSAYFDSAWYLKTYPDVRSRNENPLLHYLKYGRGAGRLPRPAGAGNALVVPGGLAGDPSAVSAASIVKPADARTVRAAIEAEFDASYYLAQYEDIAQAAQAEPRLDLVAHYVASGAAEGRNPAPWFSSNAYVDLYRDVRESEINPFYHFLVYGRHEGRQAVAPETGDHRPLLEIVGPHFDAAYYVSHNADVPFMGDVLDPLAHYVLIGWREGRNPSNGFCVSDYLDLNDAISRAGIEPFSYYLTHGKALGHVPRREMQRRIASDPSAPRVLFVGHAANQTGAEVMLLDIIQWYADNTAYQIDIILLEPGILANQYQKYGRLFISKTNDVASELRSADFLKQDYSYIYVNTVASSRFLDVYQERFKASNIPLVLHVHELSGVIELFREAFLRIISSITFFIAASDAVRTCLEVEYGIESGRIETVFSFIRPSVGSLQECVEHRARVRREFGFGPDDMVIVGAGTVYSRKGPDLFVNSIASVIGRTGRSVSAIWIGEGEDLEAVRVRIERLGLAERIRFIGFRPNARELIAVGDVFFLSSREDPFPLVCLEAASYGIPTVHFSKGTGIGALTKGGAGVECPAFDCEAAARAIVRLVERADLREKVGLEARARVLRDYDIETGALALFTSLRQRFGLEPHVSVIVPNFNHARFLNQRLGSIMDQTVKDIELIILDDASADDSEDVIRDFLGDARVSYHRNEVCSGSPFAQWEKGLDLARARLVWVAESDDFCSPNLIEVLAPAFSRGGVAISFCRTKIVDENGVVQADALRPYLDGASQGRYDISFDATGHSEINAAMAVRCTLVNGSSALFLSTELRAVVHRARGFRMCGDWRLYLELLTQGGVHYDIGATNYFRRHRDSAVHRLEGTDLYFRERADIAMAIASGFSLSRATASRMLTDLQSEWGRFSHKEKEGRDLSAYLDEDLFWTTVAASRLKLRRTAFYVHGMLFSKGGIERLAAELAKRLAAIGYPLTIFCRVWGGDVPVFPVGPNVDVVPVFDENDLDASVARLRRELAAREIEVFVPMLSEWLFEPIVAAARGLDIRVIASEHNDPWRICDLWWNAERRVETYSKVDRIHMLVEPFVRSVPEELAPKVRIIPNFVPLPSRKLERSDPQLRFVGIGRLVEQKGFDRAIRAMAVLRADFPSATLDIFGEGGDRLALQGLIDDLGLARNVHLRGLSEDVYGELVRCIALIAPSRFEGFGIAAAEAKVVGTPTIAYRTCNGLNTLVRDGIDGLLVEEDETGVSLAEAMRRLLTDGALLRTFQENAIATSDAFLPNGVLAQWVELLEEV